MQSIQSVDANGWPSHPPNAKTLVLCLDGTGDQFDDANTNIVKIFGALEKEDPQRQMVYYQTGVGTGAAESVLTPITSWVTKKVEMAVGWYLDAHIIAAYRFVQQHWNKGDRICIFGFSRGAYTARALSGFFHAVGVLPRSMPEQVDFAYKIWKSGNPSECTYYKQTMSRDCDIDFVGVFDTVASVGAIFPRALPFSTHNGKTRVFRHALALDEHRVKFRQETWHYSLPEKTFSYSTYLSAPFTWVKRHVLEGVHNSDGLTDTERRDKRFKDAMDFVEREAASNRKADIKEVWFAGDHCDVGGGHHSDFDDHSASYIPLRWMIKEAVEAGTQMVWKEDRLDDLGIRLPKTPTKGRTDAHVAAAYYGALEGIQPLTNGKTGDVWDKLSNDRLNAALADRRAGDVREKLTDNLLKFSPLWWFLEFMPIVERKQAKDDTWQLKPHLNLFQARSIPEPSEQHKLNESIQDELLEQHNTGGHWEGDGSYDALFHVSVKERMQLDDEDHLSRTWSSCFTKKEPYKPRALTSKVHPIYVE